MKKKLDKYDEQLEQERLEREERTGFKAMFKHKVVGPLSIGAIVMIFGALTPYQYEFSLFGAGIMVVGYFVMFQD